MLLKDHLVTVADVYARAVGLSRSRVSTIVLNRGATLDAIADGRADITTGTFQKAMAWFAERWPEGVAWPADIDRPDFPQDADRVSTAGAEAGLASAPALSIQENAA
jgi:hypothetical protein